MIPYSKSTYLLNTHIQKDDIGVLLNIDTSRYADVVGTEDFVLELSVMEIENNEIIE
jgi:hypothetical protein